ncbi:MAG: 4-hydroxybutyrate CoA-transferase, partial [Chlamydiae bacterium]|nr:4-hydroxybutyrate CoA-transferase [Chlamydiota bacterium]
MQIVSSAEQAISSIRPGTRIFVQGGAATPLRLLDALYEKKESFHDCELIHIHLEGNIPHGKKDFYKSFRTTSLFVGENVRKSLD